MTMCVVLRSINCDTDARLTTGVEHNVLSVVGALLKGGRTPLPQHTHSLKFCLFYTSYYVLYYYTIYRKLVPE